MQSLQCMKVPADAPQGISRQSQTRAKNICHAYFRGMPNLALSLYIKHGFSHCDFVQWFCILKHFVECKSTDTCWLDIVNTFTGVNLQVPVPMKAAKALTLSFPSIQTFERIKNLKSPPTVVMTGETIPSHQAVNMLLVLFVLEFLHWSPWGLTCVCSDAQQATEELFFFLHICAGFIFRPQRLLLHEAAQLSEGWNRTASEIRTLCGLNKASVVSVLWEAAQQHLYYKKKKTHLLYSVLTVTFLTMLLFNVNLVKTVLIAKHSSLSCCNSKLFKAI